METAPRSRSRVHSVRSFFLTVSSWATNRLFLIGAGRYLVYGVEVRTNEIVSRGFCDLWVEKVRRALYLIDELHPVVGRRLRRYVRTVVISDILGPEYVPAIRAIRLLGPKLTFQDVEDVALTIVHEVTHARIRARGIPYAEEEQARHERACVRAEVRMALKLPDGRRRAEAALAKLKNPWWTPEAQVRRASRQIDRLQLSASRTKRLKERIRRRSKVPESQAALVDTSPDES